MAVSPDKLAVGVLSAQRTGERKQNTSGALATDEINQCHAWPVRRPGRRSFLGMRSRRGDPRAAKLADGDEKHLRDVGPKKLGVFVPRGTVPPNAVGLAQNRCHRLR